MFSITHTSDLIRDAATRIRPHTLVTPVVKTTFHGKTAWLKLENQQHTGSFKARGSLNKILTLNDVERAKGIITASTGNHALGVARALDLTGANGRIFLPKNAKRAKIEKLASLGVALEFVDGGPLQSELTAKKVARESGAVWVSPYNDIEVIAGQGTIGIELVEQIPDIRRVFITVGGGGLVSGVGAFLKSVNPEIEIIGCVPSNSPEMMLSVDAGVIIHLETELPTLSDGSAGGAEDGSITFDFCRAVVDTWIEVSEDEIAHAMKHIYDEHGIQVEGSAAVAYASWATGESSSNGDVIIICGGNIEEEDFFAAIR